ncbi:MAG TPA: hypothetical protein DCM57_06025, partial [Treponema sp.]|nr:hypothetical protein [Treponema sp.]
RKMEGIFFCPNFRFYESNPRKPAFLDEDHKGILLLTSDFSSVKLFMRTGFMSFKVKIVLTSLCMPFCTSCGINSKPVERNRLNLREKLFLTMQAASLFRLWDK